MGIPCAVEKFPAQAKEIPGSHDKNSLRHGSREFAPSHWKCSVNSLLNRQLWTESEKIPCEIRCQQGNGAAASAGAATKSIN
jgi:hypothetical protein